MSDDFSKYEEMKNAGSTAEQAYAQASCDGLDDITKIRLVRALFSLSLGQAKEVSLRVQGIAESLDEFQERIANSILHE